LIIYFFIAPSFGFDKAQHDLFHIALSRVSMYLMLGSMLLGIILRLIALCGIPKYGWRGILVKAFCGILLQVIFLFWTEIISEMA